jgi:hypothetical protein
MFCCALRSILAVFLVFTMGYGLAAEPAIGLAISVGDLFVNGSQVPGNVNLFEGNTLETAGTVSELRLRGGARMTLAADSRGKIYSDRLMLEKGLGELTGGPTYLIEVRGLRISPRESATTGRVALGESNRVAVAALAGVLKVSTSAGRTVAFVEPGRPLEFDSQTGADQAVFTMTGCLEKRGGQYVVRDLIAGVLEEVRGERLERYVGSVVEVSATELKNVKPVAGAEEVIQVVRIRRVSGKCAVPPAAAKPAAPLAQPAPPAEQPSQTPSPAPQAKAPAPQQGGMSGATKAVLAGVIIGGAGAGAVLYLKLKKQEPSTISR